MCGSRPRLLLHPARHARQPNLLRPSKSRVKGFSVRGWKIAWGLAHSTAVGSFAGGPGRPTMSPLAERASEEAGFWGFKSPAGQGEPSRRRTPARAEGTPAARPGRGGWVAPRPLGEVCCWFRVCLCELRHSHDYLGLLVRRSPRCLRLQ